MAHLGNHQFARDLEDAMPAPGPFYRKESAVATTRSPYKEPLQEEFSISFVQGVKCQGERCSEKVLIYSIGLGGNRIQLCLEHMNALAARLAKECGSSFTKNGSRR